MSELESLLADLDQRGIRLGLEGEQLKIQAPRGAMSPDLQARLKALKATLIQHLREAELLKSMARSGPVRQSGRERYPLSAVQRRLWFLQQLEPTGSRYHEAAALRLPGRPDRERLQAAFATLMQRHEILRSSFHYAGGELSQRVWPQADFELIEAGAEQLEAIVTRPFELEQAPLFRLALLSEPGGSWLLVLVFHHLITDFWSAGLLLRELSELWDGHTLAAPELQYGDYALWQQGRGEDELPWWRELLADAPLILDLPRSGRGQGAGLIERVLDDETLQLWTRRGRDYQVTRFVWLLSAWQAFIGRWFGLEAGVIAFPQAGRSRKELEALPGCFVNTQLMPFRLAPDEPFSALLQRSQARLIEMLGHAEMPFERLVEALAPPRDVNYFPQLGMVMQDSWQAPAIPGLGSLTPEWVELDFLPPKFELLLSWLGFRQALRLSFDAGLHDTALMTSLIDHFLSFFKASLVAPETPLAQLPLLDADEAAARLPAPAEPVYTGLIHQFIERAEPERIALRWGDETLSYGWLNARANRWARALQRAGIAPGDRVAFRLPVSPDLICAMSAILKAGAVYVPCDEDIPPQRLDALLADCRPRLMIDVTGAGLPADQAWISPAALDAAAAELEAQNLNLAIGLDAPAYIIYTSGSTGRPNGVCISHGAAARLFTSVAEGFSSGPDDIWLLFHSAAFDYSVWEIWGCFYAGSSLVLCERARARDPEATWALIREQGVTILNQTPSAFRYLSRVACADAQDSRLRALILSGEKLELAWLADWFARFGERVELINSYGITETTVFVTWRRITAADLTHGRSVIGPALPDLGLQLLDARLQPVPAGVVGELCVSGAGLADGYWERPELTAARFVEMPHGRLYRSGDLARREADGELVYLGRRDAQIKLRGYRIEIGELIAALEAEPEVRSAWAALHQGSAGPRLLAWVIPEGDIDTFALRNRLARSLPAPMLPAAILPVAAFPLNQNGKVDVAALPTAEPALRPRETAVIAGLAGRLGELLGDLLQRPAIGPDENFFELGAHSLLMVEARSLIQERLGLQLELVDLFHYPTLRQLAAHLGEPVVDSPPVQAKPAAALAPDAPIAIVAMALRFPGADSPEALWQNLLEGVESIRRWSPEELAAEGIPAAESAHQDYVPAYGWCEGIEDFDAAFFGLSPREAELLDPQQRLMLSLAWEALDRGGYGDHTQAQPVGVFASAGISRYLLFHLANQPQTAGFNPMQLLIGNDKDFLATRVAHRLNLTGPALMVQSACSSSLAAVHLACESLRRGDCELALAGGVTLETRRQGYRWLEGAIYSRDGHCRPFDAEATGIVGGSGGAWVLLKPLDRALADRDPIYAVIEASDINNDGADKAGFLAPGVEGQRRLIANTLARAGLAPEAIGALEAHGTGTIVGDPIELRALRLAWNTPRTGFCALGSIKGNLGHLDAAAGVAGLIKAALMLHHETIAPTINVNRPNPALQLEASPFFLPAEARPWAGPDRHAAVSSLGIGGTNVHVILGAAPEQEVRADRSEAHLIPISAPTSKAFARLTQALDAALATSSAPLADLALTYQRGRQGQAWRGFVVASDAAAALAALPGLKARRSEALPKLALLCPGLGSQQSRMGAAAWQLFPAYRAALAECAVILAPLWPHDLQALLCQEQPAEQLAQPAVMQPLIFCHGYALARAWQALGLEPQAVLGHSFGEYLAAVLAGMARLEQMLPLVLARGESFATLTSQQDSERSGAVLSVAATPEQLRPLLGATLEITAFNSPDRLTLSGPRPDLAALAEAIGTDKVRWLEVPHAVHHALLDPILPALAEAAGKVKWQAPRLRVLSGPSGSWHREAPDAAYWARQARVPVHFGAGLKALAEDGPWLALELGSARSLAGLCRGHQGIEALGGASELSGLHALIGTLWSQGAKLNWQALDTPGRRSLWPVTPLSPRRHWLPAVGNPGAHLRGDGSQAFADWFGLPSWRGSSLAGTASAQAVSMLAHLGELSPDLPPDSSLWVLPVPELSDYDGALAYFDGLRKRLLALAAAGRKGRLCLVTPAISRVIGSERPASLWPMLLLGLVRCLALELPDLQARLIESDEGLTLPAGEWQRVEPHVAWRNGLRWLPELAPLGDGPVTPQLKTGGVYVITGAAGGLGRAFAAWLQQHWQASLVLLSRRQLPDAPDTLPLAVDISQPEQVHAALASAKAYFGRIDGILHCAGLPGGHSLPMLGPDALDDTLRAKILGTLNLQATLERLRLQPDFVLLCSSLASLLGSPGQSAYSGASAWLDSFASTQGTPWLSVDWGSWQGEGMAVRALERLPAGLRPLYQHLIDQGLDAESGGRALERVLGLGQSRLLVSPLALDWLEALQQRALDAIRKPQALPESDDADAEAVGDPPQGERESLVARVWERCLGLAPGRSDRFSALGGDSLMAVQMKALLEQELAHELPLGIFLKDLPLSELALALEPEAQDAADEEGEVSDLLVRLNGVAPETASPLAFVHAISGTVFPFRHLADALARPVYGLQSRGLTAARPHDEIAAMATAYRRAVEAELPQSPAGYSIGGWSFGALVAYEMARQWLAAGVPVKRLILLDMQAPEPGRRIDLEEASLRERFEADLAGLGGTGSPGIADRMKQRLWQVFEAHVRATAGFAPVPLDVDTLLLVAEKGFGATHSRPDLGWAPWLPRLEIQRIPGDHYSCLDPANLSWARFLQP